MADHGEVEYATADGNDYAEHEGTYETVPHADQMDHRVPRDPVSLGWPISSSDPVSFRSAGRGGTMKVAIPAEIDAASRASPRPPTPSRN